MLTALLLPQDAVAAISFMPHSCCPLSLMAHAMAAEALASETVRGVVECISASFAGAHHIALSRHV
jgi:hypothetical protein